MRLRLGHGSAAAGAATQPCEFSLDSLLFWPAVLQRPDPADVFSGEDLAPAAARLTLVTFQHDVASPRSERWPSFEWPLYHHHLQCHCRTAGGASTRRLQLADLFAARGFGIVGLHETRVRTSTFWDLAEYVCWSAAADSKGSGCVELWVQRTLVADTRAAACLFPSPI